MDAGLIGGLIGTGIGVWGGAVGTYFSIKNTGGPIERSFMIRLSVVAWVAVAAYLVGLFMLPQPFKWLLSLPAFALPLGIRWLNRRLLEIRAKEASARASESGRV